MSRSKRSAAAKYHDRVAARYDQSYEDEFWQWHDALTWEYIKPFLPRDASAEVIDLGCGTGTWAAKIARSGYAVTCVDLSHRMVDQARKKLDGLNHASAHSFLQADLADLSELDASRYSLALALGDPIGCTASPAKTMKQIRRVMKADGVLVATFDNRLAALDFYLQRGDKEELARFLRDGKTHWLTKDKREQFPIVTFTPNDVRRLVESTGFELLDLVGKTVLPMRHHRKLLLEAADRRAWAKLEKKLCRDPDAIGRASHLQVACRVL